MKKIFFITLCSIVFLKCRLAQDPAPRPYPSIKDSKEGGVFLNEYQPQSTYLKIEGYDYKIREAWIEHPHYEKNFGDVTVEKAYVFVMTFEKSLNDSTDLNDYTKSLSGGNTKVWFYLHGKERDNYIKGQEDTLTLHYLERINPKDRDIMLGFGDYEKLNPRERRTLLLFKKNN